jgi:hypothetical protein
MHHGSIAPRVLPLNFRGKRERPFVQQNHGERGMESDTFRVLARAIPPVATLAVLELRVPSETLVKDTMSHRMCLCWKGMKGN